MSTRPFRTSEQTSGDRRNLSAAFNNKSAPRGSTVQNPAAGQLLSHYIYGLLTQAEKGRMHLDAPMSDLVIQDSITFDAATSVHSMYGDDLEAVPFGARIEAGTPDALRNPDGSRHAAWVNVNAIYSHGDVIETDGESVITLQQAHGGSVRTLVLEEASTLNSETGAKLGDLAGLEAGHHLFFTGLAETSELSCQRIRAILINHVGLPESDG